jgi:hypothetical protein
LEPSHEVSATLDVLDWQDVFQLAPLRLEEDRGWHLTLLLLAALGIVEAVAYLWRYRTAVDRFSWQSVASTFGVCSTRIAFVAAGASAVMNSEPWYWLVAAYAIPATAATAVVHWFADSK